MLFFETLYYRDLIERFLSGYHYFYSKCLTESAKKISTIIPTNNPNQQSDLQFYLGNKYKIPREGKVIVKKDINTTKKLLNSLKLAKNDRKLKIQKQREQ